MGELPAKWRAFVEQSQARLGETVERTARLEAERAAVSRLLPLKDAFLAASSMLPQEGEETWRGMFEALEERLDLVLVGLRAEPLAQVGLPFRPDIHEVIVTVPSLSPYGTILRVVHQGYAVGGALLRLAAVEVSSGPESDVDRFPLFSPGEGEGAGRAEGEGAESEKPGMEEEKQEAEENLLWPSWDGVGPRVVHQGYSVGGAFLRPVAVEVSSESEFPVDGLLPPASGEGEGEGEESGRQADMEMGGPGEPGNLSMEPEPEGWHRHRTEDDEDAGDGGVRDRG